MNKNRDRRDYISACPLNCWDACSFRVEVSAGKVVAVHGNEDHPITKGKICARGRMLEKRTNDPNRIVHPMKKIDGHWQEISWEQAIEEISKKMLEVKENYGPTSVLHSHDYSSNGLLKTVDERFFRLFGGFTQVVGSLCWGAGIEAQKRDFGNSVSHAPHDLLNSRHIVIWGRNVPRTNLHLYPYLLEAKKKGIPIAVINPIKNELEKIATNSIQIPPSKDSFLAIGIMKVILQKHWEDKLFIEKHTYGFSSLEETLSSITMEEIVQETKVSIGELEELAKIYSNGPTSTFLGLGMQRYADGGNTIRLIDALGAISGNIGVPGGGVNYAHLPVGQSFSIDELASSKEKAVIRTFTRMNQGKKILEETDPPVKLMIVSRSNTMTQVPNSHVMNKAMDQVDTVVVVDQVLTDTAEKADYFLPTTTVFEEEDIYYASMFHSYVNFGPKIVEAPGEAKSDLWIWTELAKKLGFGEHFQYTIDEWLNIGTKGMIEKGDFSLSSLKEKGYYKLPISDIPWEKGNFPTPSGKFEFYSLKAEREGEEPRIRLPLQRENKKEYPYWLLSIHPLRSNHSQHYPYIKSDKYNTVEVSSKIAEEHSFKNGDRVRLSNEQGELIGSVRVNERMEEDTINVDEGRWNKYGGSVNILTNSGESDMGQGSILYDCKVNIEKYMN